MKKRILLGVCLTFLLQGCWLDSSDKKKSETSPPPSVPGAHTTIDFSRWDDITGVFNISFSQPVESYEMVDLYGFIVPGVGSYLNSEKTGIRLDFKDIGTVDDGAVYSQIQSLTVTTSDDVTDTFVIRFIVTSRQQANTPHLSGLEIEDDNEVEYTVVLVRSEGLRTGTDDYIFNFEAQEDNRLAWLFDTNKAINGSKTIVSVTTGLTVFGAYRHTVQDLPGHSTHIVFAKAGLENTSDVEGMAVKITYGETNKDLHEAIVYTSFAGKEELGKVYFSRFDDLYTSFGATEIIMNDKDNEWGDVWGHDCQHLLSSWEYSENVCGRTTIDGRAGDDIFELKSIFTIDGGDGFDRLIMSKHAPSNKNEGVLVDGSVIDNDGFSKLARVYSKDHRNVLYPYIEDTVVLEMGTDTYEPFSEMKNIEKFLGTYNEDYIIVGNGMKYIDGDAAMDMYEIKRDSIREQTSDDGTVHGFEIPWIDCRSGEWLVLDDFAIPDPDGTDLSLITKEFNNHFRVGEGFGKVVGIGWNGEEYIQMFIRADVNYDGPEKVHSNIEYPSGNTRHIAWVLEDYSYELHFVPAVPEVPFVAEVFAADATLTDPTVIAAVEIPFEAFIPAKARVWCTD